MTDTTAASVPAGWYLDPDDPSGNTARWWDGGQWTSQLAPVVAPTAAPAPVAPPRPQYTGMQQQQQQQAQRLEPYEAYRYAPPARNWQAFVALLIGILAVAAAAVSFFHLIPATAGMPAWEWAAAALVLPAVFGVLALRKATWTGTGKAVAVIALAAAVAAGGTGGWLQYQRHVGEQKFSARFIDRPSKVSGLSETEALRMGYQLCQMARANDGPKTMTGYLLSNVAAGVSPWTVGWVGGAAEQTICTDAAPSMDALWKSVQNSRQK
ncbi:DUF2510 domain-containing protein [Curtobacterium sp. MCBD17_040]|uniref:DUF2510 domain-containing protein n=1 Tax=Curtobacterium sp. MCBD17_040 TaxID=2175674 RepID=UPI000DA6F84A|nr:DUF2510 domain-containing protein [Curtobacterium sp. MCBD17_040]WIB65854.1 DUF2510 domain-containing protein [Curtobacterium sp. MCBD17_040]